MDLSKAFDLQLVGIQVLLNKHLYGLSEHINVVIIFRKYKTYF